MRISNFLLTTPQAGMDSGPVSCTKSKRDRTVQPADLYMMSVFCRTARAYAERTHGQWFILSAKHHLLDPYEKTGNICRRVGRMLFILH